MKNLFNPDWSNSEKWANGYHGKYKNFFLSLERDSNQFNWCICIFLDGKIIYGDYWGKSKGKTVEEAIEYGIGLANSYKKAKKNKVVCNLCGGEHDDCAAW